MTKTRHASTIVVLLVATVLASTYVIVAKFGSPASGSTPAGIIH